MSIEGLISIHQKINPIYETTLNYSLLGNNLLRFQLYGELQRVESYGLWPYIWRVKFLHSHITELSEFYQKLNLGELAVSGNSPNC